MFENILYEQNLHWNNNSYDTGIKRELTKDIIKYLDLDQVLVISGVRRSGKSYIQKQLINHLLNNKVKKENILYLNLEISELISFKDKNNTLKLIFDDYLKEKDPTGKIYLFLDEIQFISNWEVWVKEIYEKNKGKIKFILTGSNSNLLSSEFSTLLSGRTIEFRNYPFDFKSYLENNNLNIKNKQELVLKKNQIMKYFNNYLNFGGFPEISKIFEKPIAKNILQSYLDAILIKDIVPRFKIKEVSQLEKLVQFLLVNIGKLYSYNKIAKMLEIDDMTVKEYISILNKAFLFYELYKYDNSFKKQLINQKKIYTIDVGFSNNLTFKFSEDRGRLLENLVFIELKKRNKEIFYHKDKKECDFVIKKGLKIVQAIQITENLREENTKKREIDGLIDACKYHNLKEGLLLTEDEESEEIISEIKIKIMPIYKWLLEIPKGEK